MPLQICRKAYKCVFKYLNLSDFSLFTHRSQDRISLGCRLGTSTCKVWYETIPEHVILRVYILILPCLIHMERLAHKPAVSACPKRASQTLVMSDPASGSSADTFWHHWKYQKNVDTQNWCKFGQLWGRATPTIVKVYPLFFLHV